MIRVNVACALIFDSSNEKILMVRNQKGDSSYWSIPGGAVEEGETLEQAAIREAKEESGYDIEIAGLYSVREALFEERGHHAIMFTFLANIVGGDMSILDPDNDIEEVRWMDLHTANELMPYLPDTLKIKPGGTVPYHYHGRV
ncbi:NUDIX hydrolase [Paenibacillus sp. NPDC056579]|uniref:NUDIX hydrolase n=1 Tax=unclassified Paenibacillus TaxID=185978 RepID=UPI001EF7DD67|nr:NUDIX hydrolase [Paenibacillus sp. H1-7]ULL18773.1 NUDIX hydrolase [Paenibacillus sp. H1-7]